MLNSSTEENDGKLRCAVPDSCRGWRLDQALADLYPEYSRSCLQQWIREQRVEVDGAVLKPRSKLAGGENIVLSPVLSPSVDCEPQAIPLDIVFADEHLLVINKPANLVMHPAAGNRDGTVQNGLLHYEPALAAIPRAGIVHRLDKDTTGLFVVARTLQAHNSLVTQIQARTVQREYRAVVSGVLVAGGVVDAPLGRHPKDRKRMAVTNGGKRALTHFRVLEKFRNHSFLGLKLDTGRTHQIRVHLAYRGYPLVGDPVYAGRLRIPAGISKACADSLRNFPRQALHASRLALTHPHSGEQLEWQAALPDDVAQLLAQLRTNDCE